MLKMLNIVLQKFLAIFSLEHEQPIDLVKSQWQRKEKSVIYLIYRWMITAFYMFSLIYSFYISYIRGDLQLHFIYLTNLSMLTSVIFTLIGASLVTFHYTDQLKITKMTFWLKVYWILSTCCTFLAILASVVYWLILHDNKDELDVNNIILHMTNSFIALDCLIVKYKFKLLHYIWPLLFGLIYTCFSFIYPSLGGLNR